MLADPGAVVLPERRSGHDAKPVLGEARDGEVALDAATRIEHLRVRDAPHLSGEAVTAEALEERGGAFPDDVELRKRGLVEQRCGLAARAVLGTDRGRPELARPTPRAQRLVALSCVRLEPVGALPARLLPEDRAELAQSRVGRRDAQRPPGRSLVPRVLDVVVRLVDLLGADDGVLARAVRRPEAPRVHVPDVERRSPFHDPLGHELAHPAGAGEAVGTEASRDPEAPHVRRAEDELAVGREGLRPVDQLDDLHLLERRHAHDCVLHQFLEARPVLLEQLPVEVGRDPVE